MIQNLGYYFSQVQERTLFLFIFTKFYKTKICNKIACQRLDITNNDLIISK